MSGLNDHLNFRVLSPKGKNQVSERKKKSADSRVVPQCSVGRPKLQTWRMMKTREKSD